MKKRKPFAFKNFTIEQEFVTLPVTTDACIFGAFCEFNNPRNILDVGTGTGILALMMNQKYPKANVTGIEKHDITAFQASKNIEINQKNEKINIIEVDFFKHEPLERYDAIISNPPFFSNQLQSATELKNQARHLVNHTFSDFYMKIAQLLEPNGKACILLPYSDIAPINTELEASKLKVQRATPIQPNPSKIPHLIILELGFKPLETPVLNKTIVLRSEDQKLSNEAFNLLNPFYLDQALNL